MKKIATKHTNSGPVCGEVSKVLTLLPKAHSEITSSSYILSIYRKYSFINKHNYLVNKKKY